MPISAIDGCSEEHWKEVLSIITSAVAETGLEPNLVSESSDVGVIQKRIVQNLYDNKVVVCDISARNPNVMFELGMRLAFDKPVIIIKDDVTPYSFDTSPVEHLTYPRDLRFSAIVEFKEKLTKKIKAVAVSDQQDSFLKSFGKFRVAELSVESAPVDTIILEELAFIKRTLRLMDRSAMMPRKSASKRVTVVSRINDVVQIAVEGYRPFQDYLRNGLAESKFIKDANLTYILTELGPSYYRISIRGDELPDDDTLIDEIEGIALNSEIPF